MIMQKRGVSAHLSELLHDPITKFGEVRNYVLARKPRFAIIGTGRSGTTYVADYLTKAGVPVSHESYFTFEGPKLRTPLRDWRTQGDSSWCAVPFLPDPDIVAIHQVRHPYKVIESFYNTGFFDPAHREGREGFVRFVQQYFEFSDDPLRSCLRWYVEWNAKCEAITTKRYQIERFSSHVADIEAWLGLDGGLGVPQVEVASNARTARVSAPISGISEALRQFPEYPQLEAMAERYGYEL